MANIIMLHRTKKATLYRRLPDSRKENDSACVPCFPLMDTMLGCTQVDQEPASQYYLQEDGFTRRRNSFDSPKM